MSKVELKPIYFGFIILVLIIFLSLVQSIPFFTTFNKQLVNYAVLFTFFPAMLYMIFYKD